MAQKQVEQFVFSGDQMCLDFVNTQVIRSGQLTNLLSGFADFISWLVEAQVIQPGQAEEISKQWKNKPEAERVLRRAFELRDALRKMAERLVQGKPPPQDTVETINRLLRQQIGYTEIKKRKDGFEKEYHAQFSEPIHLLFPIAESAADLLCYADHDLIKKCESEKCVLFFYDTTKNHSRRWCSMSGCGNREKVAAHYRRRRAAKKH